jgi:hypothetical protein
MRVLMVQLEVIARRNPGQAPEIIAHVRKLERVALFADRYATGISKRERHSSSASDPEAPPGF